MNEQFVNEAELCGRVVGEVTFSHMVKEEIFYSFSLAVERLSKETDVILCTVSKKLLRYTPIREGDCILARGQIRSYNKLVSGENRLEIRMFLFSLERASEPNNTVILTGYVAKAPVYRKTPFGREITDVLLAVNRSYHKSDYIPVIAWGKTARWLSTMTLGKKLCVTGRLQSRNYEKKTDDGMCMTRMVHEVSASKIELMLNEP